MFRKIRSIKLPYKKQGYIRFTCWNYEDLPQKTQALINRICAEVGGEDAPALREFLTTDKTAVAVAMKYFVRENKLYDMRREFYIRFHKAVLER